MTLPASPRGVCTEGITLSEGRLSSPPEDWTVVPARRVVFGGGPAVCVGRPDTTCVLEGGSDETPGSALCSPEGLKPGGAILPALLIESSCGVLVSGD